MYKFTVFDEKKKPTTVLINLINLIVQSLKEQEGTVVYYKDKHIMTLHSHPDETGRFP